MNPNDYERERDELLRARKTIDETYDRVLEEAESRGEVYVLDAWYYGGRSRWSFLTLEEAVDRASDDCVPEYIVGPDGTRYEPYTGNVKENS